MTPILFVDRVLKFKDAVYENGRQYRRDLPPGAACWSRGEAGHIAALHFVCPCGCGLVHACPLKPHHPTGWDWDGRLDIPTLAPSIFANPERGGCGWHGYLTKGEFKPC